MAHYIHGFIARHESLFSASDSLSGVVVAPLGLGFGFLPVTEDIAGPTGTRPFECLHQLTDALAGWAIEQSRKFPIAYIETNYFGTGTQAAVVWRDGVTVFGPEISVSKWEAGEYVSQPLLDRAINCSLRLLGADRGEGLDEFDAVGLGRHRFDDAWMKVGQRNGKPGDAAGGPSLR